MLTALRDQTNYKRENFFYLLMYGSIFSDLGGSGGGGGGGGGGGYALNL